MEIQVQAHDCGLVLANPSVGSFQILGLQGVPGEEEQPAEVPPVDPDQQRRVEEQQRKPEAVTYKDRVRLAAV